MFSQLGRIIPSFRQLYEEIISELRTELQAALVDLGHKSAFDLLLKEAWNPEQAAMGNSTLPTVSDKLNVMASIHNRKLISSNDDMRYNKNHSRLRIIDSRTHHMQDQEVWNNGYRVQKQTKKVQ